MVIWSYCDCGEIIDEFQENCDNCGKEVEFKFTTTDIK